MPEWTPSSSPTGFTREGLLRSYLLVDDQRADAIVFSLLPADLTSEPRSSAAAPEAAGRRRSRG